jgi:hypothetical protein
MVALAGWPEPVYVPQPAATEWESAREKRKSRPGTPKLVPAGLGWTQDTEVREIRDGISLAALLNPIETEGGSAGYARGVIGGGERETGNGKGVADETPQQSIFTQGCPYSSAGEGCECPIPGHPHKGMYQTLPPPPPDNRGMPPPPLPHRTTEFTPTDSAASTSALTGNLIPLPSSSPSSSSSHTTVRRETAFNDPRYSPNASLQPGRPLRVVPAWSSSRTSSHEPDRPASLSSTAKYSHFAQAQSQLYQTMHAAHSQGNTKLLRPGMLYPQRAVPDVYPLPNGDNARSTATSQTHPLGDEKPVEVGEGRRVVTAMGGMGLATEVYPRDPDSAYMWGAAIAGKYEDVARRAGGGGKDGGKLCGIDHKRDDQGLREARLESANSGMQTDG